jgi:hypothetical protein
MAVNPQDLDRQRDREDPVSGHRHGLARPQEREVAMPER